MTQRMIALGAALTFAVSSIAQAAPLPSASATVATSAAAQGATTTWVDPPAKIAAKPLPSAPVASQTATGQGLASVKEPANTEPVQEPAAAQAAETRKHARASRRAAPAPVRQAAKPRVVRTVRYAAGEGGAWRTGRDSFGFSGFFGGCRISGFAGSNGYRLNRLC
ncbi:hypothetical protein HCU64_07245 [Methylobacterium sp. C25]|uniref:hypothetical protein n=1 Tax=Methylobacterium sp. C25 TaxID=2721622 RepID=UPI001F16F075|nr:hypothetical protein [Methylobacterium sp. C25]MCE4223541.1 hypothetical protein [Methylobacterium sp. C25]